MDVLVNQTKPTTDAEYEAMTDQLLKDMHALNVLMDSDRAETERLKAETKLLREEGVLLQARVWDALHRLQATKR